jgi:hypothetical protein
VVVELRDWYVGAGRCLKTELRKPALKRDGIAYPVMAGRDRRCDHGSGNAKWTQNLLKNNGNSNLGSRCSGMSLGMIRGRHFDEKGGRRDIPEHLV